MRRIGYIALGSNLCEPTKQLQMAVEHISRLPKTRILLVSRLYETTPLGPKNQPNFMNQVISIETGLTALALLKSLQLIENQMGRVRNLHWGPRIIDCDILLYGNLVIDSDTLTVPHPGLTTRAFVLYPLFEIAPELVLPNGEKVRDLIRARSLECCL